MEIRETLALVTGASRGIGAATASALAAAGAEVVLLARSGEELERRAAEIEAGGGVAHCYPIDLTQPEAIGETAAAIVQRHGTPDILVNNAGAGRWLLTEETPVGEEEQMIRLPYLAAFQITRALLPGMLQRRSGSIVNVNSPASVMPWRGAAAYTAARWALRGFTKSLRIDLHGTGVHVCHCVFGKVRSHYFEANPGAEERLPRIAKLIPELTVEQTAAHIVRAIRRNRRELTRPGTLALFRAAHRLMPGAVDALVRATSWKPTS